MVNLQCTLRLFRSHLGSSFEALSGPHPSRVPPFTLSPRHGLLADCQLELEHCQLELDVVRACIEGRGEEELRYRH